VPRSDDANTPRPWIDEWRTVWVFGGGCGMVVALSRTCAFSHDCGRVPRPASSLPKGGTAFGRPGGAGWPGYGREDATGLSALVLNRGTMRGTDTAGLRRDPRGRLSLLSLGRGT
jgi:hypothetical protein